MNCFREYLIILLAVFPMMLISLSHAAPEELLPGESVSVDVPAELKSFGIHEGYFYTPGPLLVFAYDRPCVIAVRDPAHPNPPVAQGSIDGAMRSWETTLAPGFYYIQTTQDAGVLAGVDATHRCSGFYQYRSSGDPYGDSPLESLFYFRTTIGCEGRCYIFSPGGASSGRTCCDPICLDPCGITFDNSGSLDYTGFDSGETLGVLQVDSGAPVMVLSRDDGGYFVPPYSAEGSVYSYFYTYQGSDDNLNIHSFEDDVDVVIQSLQTSPPTTIWSGNLDKGETHVHPGSIIFGRQVIRVRTDRNQAAVSVLGGSVANDTNYMTYALDSVGNMQGTDFITQSHAGGFIYITGLTDGTQVEVRDTPGGGLRSTQLLNRGQVVNVNPGTGTWRIRGDKDFTACVGKGVAGTYIPLTKNTSGSSPYPPIIAGVNWTPYFPTTLNSTLTVRWLTDENTTTSLSYRFGAGAWQNLSNPGYRTEHQLNINIEPLTLETEVQFRISATDQSGATTVDDNSGAHYRFMVRRGVPNLNVTLNNVVDQGSYYTMNFMVQNSGAARAVNSKVKLRLFGMQPFSANVTSDYVNVESARIDPTLPVQNLDPGGTTFVSLNVKPFLSHAGSINYRMEACASDYEDEWGHSFHSDYPTAVHDWDDNQVEGKLYATSYVILANPIRFYSAHSQSGASAQSVMRELAVFANFRNATLAYITSGHPEDIRNYIQGRFNGKVTNGWTNGGYLLLVGSSAIMPSFGWHLECTLFESFDLWMSDNTYANLDNDGHFTPELCIGRLTGDSPDTYVALLSRAQSPHFFDKALCISGTGDGEGTFADNASNCRDRLDARYFDAPFYRLGSYPEADRAGIYPSNANNTDFLYYRNHGSVDGWDYFSTGDVASLNFGTKFPMVYSNACLTGQVQTDGNLAEEFLARCASVFIGATQVSPRSENNSMGNKITAYHRSGLSIGQAFRNAKRELAGDIHWYTLCINDLQIYKEILMYNLYGDPMRGGSVKADKDATDKSVYDTPTNKINITVPMYQVDSGLDGLDHPTIPDSEHGDLLLSLNEPIVPIYRWKASYAPGVRVNKIEMSSRTGLTQTAGLTLPLAWGNEKRSPGPGDVPSPGFFPTDDFHWTSIERPDGGIDVVLAVHPFFHNSQTLESNFYSNYAFQMDWSTSKISIDKIDMKFDSAPVGSKQVFTVAILNGETTNQNVDVFLEISNIGTGDSAGTISKSGINLAASNTQSVVFTWNTAGHTPGGYMAKVRVADHNSGDERDVAYSPFHLGVYDLKSKSFYMNPKTSGFVDVNEKVPLSMTVENSGDIPNSVTAFLQIKNTDTAEIIDEFTFSNPNVAVNGNLICNQLWDSTGLEPGNYQYVGWAEHRGGTLGPFSIPFERVRRMRTGWSMPSDTYRRGDKIMAVANLFDDQGHLVGPGNAAALSILKPNWAFFSQPLIPHANSPYYSTSFIINAQELQGAYALVSAVTKTGYQTSLGGRWFVVDDQAFGMTATPPVAIADGASIIQVQSEVVNEGGNPIPNGTQMTCTPWTGTVISPDVNPILPGIQVASSGGRFTIDWKAPTAPSPDAFLYGTLGDTRPKSGVTAQFKGIIFNNNRHADVMDILFVQDGNQQVFGSPAYDIRKDLNENEIIDLADRNQVLARWGMQLGGTPAGVTATAPVKDNGIILRLVPGYANMTPGSNLTVDIVAENVSDFGGYEFVSALNGTACSFQAPPQATTILESTGNSQTVLGPDTYMTGFRNGVFATGSNPGPDGTRTLATVTLHADHYGTSSLILSSIVLSTMNGEEIPLMQASEGVYVVEDATPIPTPTPTHTQLVTATPTRSSTPTPSPTGQPVEGDTNGDGQVNMNDVFYFSQYWRNPSSEADPSCNPETDPIIDQKDLLILMKNWSWQTK